MQADVSRRGFLRSVGVAGGAGVLYSTMGAMGLAPVPEAHAAPFVPPQASDFKLTGRGGRKVVVLGAGIAGLVTAYELDKAGYDVKILEYKNRSGGRNWTARGGTVETDLDGRTQRANFSNGQYMNCGPGRLPQSHVTLDYCRELGVAIEPFINANANAYIFHENGPLGGRPMQWRTAKADVYGYISELLAKATDQGALDAALTKDDKDRLIAFLQSFGAIKGKADGFKYDGTSRRGYSVEPGAADNAGTVLGPVPSMSDVLASGVGQRFSFELGYDQAMMMYQPVGGMDAIPKALEKAIGKNRIVYQAEATSVANVPGGVEVTYKDKHGRERLERADFAVVATPPMIAARLRHNLGTDVTAALNTPRKTSAGKIGLEYRSRWWETDLRMYGGVIPTDMDLSNMWIPSAGFHDRRGVIIGYYNTGGNADAYGALAPKDREARAVAQGVKIFGPKYRDELDTSFSVAWQRTPGLEAAWVGWPNQSTSAEYKLLNRPHGNVWFAGDWLSYVIAWQHGAIESARKVVTEIHQKVMSS